MGDAWRRYVLVSALLASSGCVSSAVAGAAASTATSAPVVALLPFTLTLDALLLALLGATQAPAPAPSGYGARGFEDPGDWVASCEGPLFCPKHRHFVCTGKRRACECHCEITPPTNCVPAIPEDGTSVACQQAPPAAPPRGQVAAR
jgi:hypothetical protein